MRTSNNWFIHKTELAAMKTLDDRMFHRLLFSTPDQEELTLKRRKDKEDNRKWAYIIVGKTRMMAWVDNKTMKAYKTDGYAPTWIEIKNFTFERWCTSFDL